MKARHKHTSVGAPLQPMAALAERKAVIDAISRYELAKSDAWGDLRRLADKTTFEAADAVPEGIFETQPGRFAAAATVYVKYHYDDSTGGSTETDEFPAEVTGHFEKTKTGHPRAVVETFNVDTSSFPWGSE